MTTTTKTAKNGTEAFKMIQDFLGKEISFDNASTGFNREDTFTFRADKNIFVTVTCTPDNSRVEAIEIINTGESGSARRPLTVYISAEAETTTKEETKMKNIETRIAKNGNVSFYSDGERVKEQDVIHQVIKNGGTYYTAHSYSYTGRLSWERFLTPITAYKWLCRLAAKNHNHADGTWIIKRCENHTQTVIFESSDNKYECGNAELESYIETRENAQHIKICYREILGMVKNYSKHYGLTLEQAEQICVTIYAADQRKQYDTKAVINRMIEDFQAANAAAAEPIDDESPFEIDDESPFDLLPSIDELNDTLSDFEIEDEQFAGEDTDRNARFNRGERLAEAATSRIRKFDKTADITFNINEDGEDTFLLDSSTIYRTPFGTAADAEQAFFDIIGIEETAEIDLANDTREDIFQKLIPAAEKEISITVESFSKAHEMIQSVNANFEFEGEVQGFQGSINLVERFFRAPYTTYSFVEYFTDSGDLHHIDFKNGAGFRARVIKIFIESHVDDTPIIETVTITDEGNEFRSFTVNNETVTYFNGELNFIKSDTYHASLAAYRNQYVVEVPDGRWKKFKRLDADEFFQVMSERGACSIDGKPEPPVAPQSDFAAKLAALKDAYDKAEKVVAEKKIVLDEAEKEYRAAGNISTAALGDLQTFLLDAREQLTKELLADIESPYEIAITAHNGLTYKTKLRDAFFLFGNVGEYITFLVSKEASCINWKLATYDTLGKMKIAIEMLKAAIARGDKSFTFPPAKTADACQEINSNAPDGWNVDTDNDKFSVKFNGQSVATLDSLALAKVLPLEKFFEQFKPLADKSFDAKKQFIADRQREIEQLKEMREELAGDPERLKIIDKLITQNELAG